MHCRICENNTVELLIDFGMQPIIHQLSENKDKLHSNYPFRLGHCTSCNFLGLMEFIEPDVLYENYFTPSGWKNQPHIPRLIDLIHSLMGIETDNTILEIGSNDGNFLKELRDKGYKKLYGVEPTTNTYKTSINRGFEVHNCFFSKSSAEEIFSKNYFDLVVTRQVLEHIPDLHDFLEGITYVIKDKGSLIIEVPDSQWNLDYLDYALWEEHVNYFTINTIRNLLKKHSFEVIYHEGTLFSGKALTVFCQKVESSSIVPWKCEEESTKILKYRDSWGDYNKNLIGFLDSINSPIVIYGCGARSCNFVNFMGISNWIHSFVDDQQEKQGLYVPGNKLNIRSWDQDYFKDFVFLLGVNTENEYKVINNRQLGHEQFYSILPPSKNLPEFWNSLIYA